MTIQPNIQSNETANTFKQQYYLRTLFGGNLT